MNMRRNTVIKSNILSLLAVAKSVRTARATNIISAARKEVCLNFSIFYAEYCVEYSRQLDKVGLYSACLYLLLVLDRVLNHDRSSAIFALCTRFSLKIMAPEDVFL